MHLSENIGKESTKNWTRSSLIWDSSFFNFNEIADRVLSHLFSINLKSLLKTFSSVPFEQFSSFTLSGSPFLSKGEKQRLLLTQLIF